MSTIQAYAAHEAGGELVPFEYQLPPIAEDEVEIDVSYCGICHSDLSMLQNDWRMTTYPFVPGHEVIGRVSAVGERVKHLTPGQSVGLGWIAGSCMICDQCMGGDHNLCRYTQQTIVGRYGGFASKVRAKAAWVLSLPDGLREEAAGPLFCGGITVFNPIVQMGVNALDHVGVVGIGGLGHMALAFLNAWGCEVTAFSTSPEKEEEAGSLGAHHFVNIKDAAAFRPLSSTFDLILVTSNVELPWESYIRMLRPRGRLHIVGAAPSVNTSVFSLMGGQKSISASPTGSPIVMRRMLEFAARHNIHPVIEKYGISEVNDAMEHLRHGKPRYRIVLEV